MSQMGQIVETSSSNGGNKGVDGAYSTADTRSSKLAWGFNLVRPFLTGCTPWELSLPFKNTQDAVAQTGENGDQMPPSLERCEPRHLKLDAVRDLQANRG